MNKLIRAALIISLICFASVSFAADSAYVKQLIETKGAKIVADGNGGYIYDVPFGPGLISAKGPLAGKKIGIIAGCSFSDFQAYYLASYIGEFGGTVQFILSNSHLWKSSKAPIGIPTEPLGTWGLALTGNFNGLGMNGTRCLPPVNVIKGEGLSAGYPLAKPEDYDAIIILGDYAGDIMYSDWDAIPFLQKIVDRGVPFVGINGGVIPMIKLKLVQGKNVTGGPSTEYMLKKIANFKNVGDGEVVVDGKIITAKNTLGCPAALRALCKVFDPNFVDKDKGILKGKKVLAMITDDFEDIEVAAPYLELWYKGATFIVGMFDRQLTARTSTRDPNVRTGQIGIPIPFGEIDQKYYKIIKGKDLKMSDFDAVFMPGAFSPWQMIETKKPIEFIKKANKAGKVIGLICHAPLAGAAADIVKGKNIAGWTISEDPVKIMGGNYDWKWSATWDGKNIVSGRIPCDIAQFLDMMTAAMLQK